MHLYYHAGMATISSLRIAARWLLVLCAWCVFAVGAAAAEVVDHAFSFDAILDSPDIEIVDYRYGDSDAPMARNPAYLLDQGQSLQSTNINGAMRVGASLFVKWRIKGTGEVHKDTVDLSRRLPADITDHRLHFIVRGSRLYIYLISPQRRPPEMPPVGPRAYRYLKAITIYPDQPQPSSATEPYP